MPRISQIATLCCGALLSACQGGGADARADGLPAVLAPPPAPAEPPPRPLTADASHVLARVDTSGLGPAQKEALWALMQDEVCFCGCPHSLAGCLREHQSCRHAVRMANLAARALGEHGRGAAQAILTSYYAGFPRAKRKDLPLDGVPFKGERGAPVRIAVFSDFQCPHCAAAAKVMEKLVERMKGKVAVHYLHYPLGGHPQAEKAAQVAELAREKGKFWEMHDAIFADQEHMENKDLLRRAVALGLDEAQVAKVLEAGLYLDRIRAQKALGDTLGLTHTPTIYVNGRELVLPPTLEYLTMAVEDELEWAQNGGAWSKDM